LQTLKNIFNPNNDFRVQIFNALGLFGAALGIFFGTVSLVFGHGVLFAITNYGVAIFMAGLIWRAGRTKKYGRYFLFTVVVVFIVLFPVLFFFGGGYGGGMPSFFLFASVFTVIMLEGKRRVVFSVSLILLYILCFIIAFNYPGIVRPFLPEAELAIDVIVSCVAATVVLSAAIHLFVVVYEKKQKELEAANEALNGINRMKTEFLQNIKHEIKNPLHVISLGADFIQQCIRDCCASGEANEALGVIQNEAMRLGRMINGMVELAVLDGAPANRKKVDLTKVIADCIKTFRIQSDRYKNKFHMEIPDNLPYVYSEEEQMERVLVNLLSNAAEHTRNGEITLSVSADLGYITVKIRDTGEGIDGEFLPGIFERGVFGKNGKSYGLSICKTIVEAHGGSISIESVRGEGTEVAFTVPVYGGQSETGEYE